MKHELSLVCSAENTSSLTEQCCCMCHEETFRKNKSTAADSDLLWQISLVL